MDERAEKIALIVAYHGAPFSGFQAQRGRETVQGRLESALKVTLGRPVSISCAGRTDAGVHASGQVVSFEAHGDEPPSDALARSLNALAGPAIVVRDVLRAASGFDARRSAVAREYRYHLASGPVPPVFTSEFAWWVKGGLDRESMQRAARTLVGEHDFASFCVSESAKGRSTVREVLSLDVRPLEELDEELIAVDVRGNAFLHSMVRVIVGSLVEVGLHRRAETWIAEALQARERSAAGQTAPPHGLVLRRVEYEAGALVDRG